MRKRLKRLLKVLFMLPLIPIFGIPGAEGGGAEGGEAADGGGGAAKADGKDPPTAPKKYDEGELDRIAGERSEAAKNKALSDYFKAQGLSAEDAKKAMEDYKVKKAAETPTAEKLREVEENARKAVETANGRIVQSELKAAASALGVKAEKIPYLLKMAEVSGIEVKDDGSVDEKAVKAALEKVLADIPELKANDNKPGYKPPDPVGGQGAGSGEKPKNAQESIASKINKFWKD